MEVEIKFEPSERSGVVAVGSYLFDAANRLGIGLEAECERRGECSSCAVKIKQGRELLSEVTKAEIKNLSESQRNHGKRLSCQVKIERQGELVVMASEKKQEEKTKTKEEEKADEFRKEFGELPLEKKVANLLELEAITLGETFSIVLNSPFKIFEKVMDVMAEFGLKSEDKAKNAKRPAEHKTKDKGAPNKKTRSGKEKSDKPTNQI